MPFDAVTWLIWLGALVVVLGVAEGLTAWRRHRRLSALPGNIMTGRSLWQKRGWALYLFVLSFVVMLAMGYLESKLEGDPLFSSLEDGVFYALVLSLLVSTISYIIFPFPRIVALDDAGGAVSEPDSKPVRFEWADILATGTLGKSGIWTMTEAGNVYWLSAVEGYDAIVARLREKAGGKFYEDRSPLGILRGDRLSDAEPTVDAPPVQKLHARLSLKYGLLAVIVLALFFMIALLQLPDALEDGAWLPLLTPLFYIGLFGSFIILTLFRRRYLELSPEGWRRCGFTRGELREWQYCSRFSNSPMNGLKWKYGPIAKAVRPIEFYGHPPDELADRLNTYRDQALAAMGRG